MPHPEHGHCRPLDGAILDYLYDARDNVTRNNIWPVPRDFFVTMKLCIRNALLAFVGQAVDRIFEFLRSYLALLLSQFVYIVCPPPPPVPWNFQGYHNSSSASV